MTKRILLTVVALIVLVGILAGIKFLQIRRMTEAAKSYTPPPATVSTAQVRAEAWETRLDAVGSFAAVQGVTVAAELPGKVTRIAFEPGAMARKGDLLVQMDIAAEKAQLRSAQAALSLAKTNLDRMTQLLARQSIAQSEYDTAEEQFKQAAAEVDNIRAIIDKKTIRAPFAGRLGIRLISLGQILAGGEAIVSLQTLNPIFVNFLLPQQYLSRLQQGLTVQVTTDALPGEVIEGKVTAINPEVDPATRNIRVQATVENVREELRPGMFANAAVVLPVQEQVLAIPATAVLYAPYSDSVFIVEKQATQKNGPPAGTVRQQFVRLGRKRGDFVSVISGLKEGDTIVSTGVFKLRNGQAIVVDNTLSPAFKLKPDPSNS